VNPSGQKLILVPALLAGVILGGCWPAPTIAQTNADAAQSAMAPGAGSGASMTVVDRAHLPDVIQTTMDYTGKGTTDATVLAGRLTRHDETPKGTFYKSDLSLAFRNFIGSGSIAGGIFIPKDPTKAPQIYSETAFGQSLLKTPPMVLILPIPIVPSQAAWETCVAQAARTTRLYASCAALEPVRPDQQMPAGPVRSDYETAARAYITSRLKDPESGRIRLLRGPIAEPTPSALHLPQGAELARRPEYGWVACFGVNARNSYGGYTGEQIWVVILKGDRWSAFSEEEGSGAAQSEIARSVALECQRAD
jgi:hypothetical protein